MKLRNKKTGEVFDALIREKGGGGSYSLIVCDVKAYEQSKSTLDETHFILDEYETLAELNEEWEDYAPKEPLINDGGARDAVYSWASALGIHEVRCKKTARGVEVITFEAFGLGSAPRIEFAFYSIDTNVTDGAVYTIAELCGEEEK